MPHRPITPLFYLSLFMSILGQVWLSKGYEYPAALDSNKDKAPHGLESGKKRQNNER